MVVADIHVSHDLANGHNTTTATFTVPNIHVINGDGLPGDVRQEKPPKRGMKRKQETVGSQTVIGDVIVISDDSPVKTAGNQQNQDTNVSLQNNFHTNN